MISRPADPAFAPLNFALNQGQSQTIDLLSILPIDQVECHADTAENHGFMIQAFPGNIIAYYEMDNRFNRDIYTLKGSNALGTEFTVTTQNIFPNGSNFPDAKSGFVVVATQDNTTITVESDQDFVGAPAGVNTITLNRGQTYNFEAVSQDAAMHPQGVKVTSDRPIAITIYDDSMASSPLYGNGGCRDAFCDQYIPECHTGREYVIMNGQLGVEGINTIWRDEIIFVTAVSDSTIIRIDGIAVDTIHSRDVASFVITNPFTSVLLSNPGYVNYITGTGFGCEQGGAVLPTIDNCTGSNTVTFARSGPSSDMFSLNIMVRNDTLTGSPGRNQATSNFTLTVGGNSYAIPNTFFAYTANDSSKAVLIDDSRINGPIYNFFDTIIPTGNPPTVAQMSNPNAKFHLGVLNGGAVNGGKYGYFSDYSTIPSAGINGSINTKAVYCGFDPIPLQANGGVNYAWRCISHPELSSNFDRTDSSNVFFTPLSTHDITYSFEVDILNECSEIITISVEVTVILSAKPSFELSLQEGCSPLEVTITNTSDSDYTEELIWTFENPYIEVDQDTMSNSFNWILPVNVSDDPQNYYVTLNGTGKYNSCPASYKDTIVIYPEISAGFDMASTVYCDSVVCVLENTSSGDSLNTYSWDFGDQTADTTEDVNKVYLLEDYYDTTLQIRLISTSQWNCTDTTFNDVVLPLSVHAKFETSGDESCPPLSLIMDASASEMVDTMGWTIQSTLGDTLIDAEVDQLIHYDYPASGPDTIHIQLYAEDTNGCSDISRDTVIVYVTPTASFEATPKSGSSPLDVEFSNLSTHAETYYWDFGNGNTSSVFEPLETFETEVDKTFEVQLIAENGFCRDTTNSKIEVTGVVNTPFVDELNLKSDYKVYINQDNHLIMEYTVLNSIKPFGYVVYDITGKVITTSDRKQIVAGTYSESISLDGVAPGVFIVKTHLNGKVRVDKISYY
jgi:PKD repeat protein